VALPYLYPNISTIYSKRAKEKDNKNRPHPVMLDGLAPVYLPWIACAIYPYGWGSPRFVYPAQSRANDITLAVRVLLKAHVHQS